VRQPAGRTPPRRARTGRGGTRWIAPRDRTGRPARLARGRHVAPPVLPCHAACGPEFPL